jgi:hypothetical protein
VSDAPRLITHVIASENTLISALLEPENKIIGDVDIHLGASKPESYLP